MILLKVLPGGYRYALCPRCYSSDWERLVYWYIVNKTNILHSQKIIKLLHIAPEKNLQKVFKTYSKIKYINVDLNPLVTDRKIDITNMSFKGNFLI